jgi:phosphohistidine phosphatase
MELLLWRHAEAESSAPDLERKLTAKGEKQARRVAQWLNDHLPESARIVSSPAVRTRQTAQALVELSDRRFRVVQGLAPGVTPEEFLRAVDWPDARGTVVAVGHQPTLGLVASRLLCGAEQPWAIRKGSLWWFSSRSEEGSADVALVAMINPSMM